MDTGSITNIDHRRLDGLRSRRGQVQEHVIDEFVAGRLSRREFIRRGTMIGLSAPIIGGILDACDSPAPHSNAAATGRPGGTITIGIIGPASAINPITLTDQGSGEMIAQVGEWLVFVDQQYNYHPWLATSWSPNANASVWTFKIRQGVKFSDGTPMTVDDVVYSFKSQCDPNSSANALSVFGGTLDPDGVVKVDDSTIAFHLEAPNASFVDMVSPDNYNMIIVPNGYNYADYQKSFIGTGKFIKTSYTPNVGASFARNPHYWGKAALPGTVEYTFYPDEAARTSALEAGAVDCIDQFSVAVSPQLLNGGYNVTALKASTHRELSMRTDIAPFTSKYVRQAIAYTLDRPGIVAALFKGHAQVGNDNPFAPVFKATDTSIPQRSRNLKLAEELLAKGGVPRGFATPLVTTSKYYGSAVFGKSDWLDGEMSLVDYAARAVPNLFLEAPLQSTNAKTGQGAWNAARFSDPTYDQLSREFVATPDLSTQRRLAGQIEALLLDETPIIYPYFYDYLSASQKNVTGVYPLAMGAVFLWNASKS